MRLTAIQRRLVAARILGVRLGVNRNTERSTVRRALRRLGAPTLDRAAIRVLLARCGASEGATFRWALDAVRAYEEQR